MPLQDFPDTREEQDLAETREEKERKRDLYITSLLLGFAFAAGGTVIWLRFLVPAAFSGFGRGVWIATGQTFISLLWGGAWFAAAFLFGFLFAIPKALQTSGKPTSSTGTGSSGQTNDATESRASNSTSDRETTAQGKEPVSPLKVNTNLEEISDWLTKILVGATLTQIVKIPGSLKNAAEFMALDGTAPAAFAAAIIVYFCATGFLAGYLLTRMFFSLAFARFDRGLTSPPPVGDVLAKKIISAGSNPETTEDAYNSVVFSSLYDPAPMGFEKAIKYANEFLAQNTPTRASIHINLACAYGQQFGYLQRMQGSGDDMKKAREGALTAVRKAIELDPESKRRLRELMHPQPASRDNDLAVFASDPDFVSLIDQ